VTPAIVVLELYLYGQRLSIARTRRRNHSQQIVAPTLITTVATAGALALLGVCVGVGAAVVNDVSINTAGLGAALAWLPVAALYKVFWSRVAKEEGWHTFALMRRVLPLSTVMLLLLVPLLDPPGAFTGPARESFQPAARVQHSSSPAGTIRWLIPPRLLVPNSRCGCQRLLAPQRLLSCAATGCCDVVRCALAHPLARPAAVQAASSGAASGWRSCCSRASLPSL
jgi:hypothetical protein